jgi:ADP-heptose:LPS heptosyltransferase
LGPRSGRRIGVNWRGRASNKREIWRAASAKLFSTFLDLPGLDIVNLQKDATPEELSSLGEVTNIAASLDDFADTAGVIAGLDLVVTVDTAMAHLAGALGARCWVLLDYAADWQWLSHPRTSPWYPSVRLFRQPEPGDWRSVTTSVRAELEAVR